MNDYGATSENSAASVGGDAHSGTTAGLHDAVHALAQPLTALTFLLELGRMQSDPVALRAALSDASVECQRAIERLEDVREAVHALDEPGGWRQ